MANLDVHSLQNRLGRLYAEDERDKEYLIPRKAVRPSVRMKFYPTGPILDQGNTPMCVEYAGVQFLRTGPVSNRFTHIPGTVYHECQLVDEWEGENYDGTSVRALMKTFQGLGYITEYRWAFDVETAINHILTTGPVVFGTDWYYDMFDLDRQGFLNVGGGIAGGHAYLGKGVNLDYPCPDGSKGAIRIVNSWGSYWGTSPNGGCAWISIKDMSRLIQDNGEAATASEVIKNA